MSAVNHDPVRVTTVKYAMCIKSHDRQRFTVIDYSRSMPNVLRSSRISQKSEALIFRYSQKKELICYVSYCFENPSIAHNFGTTG